MTDTATPCSKCGAALDTDGSPKWCKACRARYKREYEDLRLEKHEKSGFSKGVRAMREQLAQEFERIGSAGVSGYEAAGWVRNTRGPQPDA